MHKYIANEIINLERFTIAKGFNEHSFIYRNTNENINGYLSQLNIKDKNVLTVASSGDHALISLLHKAKTVETFDINHFAKFYQELKISAYQILNYEDFINFFYTEKGFTYDIFEKITNLPKEIQEFWQYLFDYHDDYEIIDSQLFSNFEYSYDILKNTIPYLNKEYFYQNKTINNLTFYQYNALNLPTALTKKYDIIMLSSIPNFIKDFYNLEAFKNYLEQLSNYLTSNGIIICNYLYNINETKGVFKNDEAISKTFKNGEVSKLVFNSVNNTCQDAVLVYQKNL